MFSSRNKEDKVCSPAANILCIAFVNSNRQGAMMPICSYDGIIPIVNVETDTPIKVKDSNLRTGFFIARYPNITDPIGLVMKPTSLKLYKIINPVVVSSCGKNTGAKNGAKNIYSAES